jgi:nucleoside 2-deoxyribosyltransferase
MKKKKIYTAGNFIATVYRETVKSFFKDDENIKVIDPLVYEHNISPDKCYTAIVETDKFLILDCDIVLAYIYEGKSSFGTTMEIMFGYMKDKPIIIVDETKKTINDYWLKYHAYENFIHTDLIEVLKNIKTMV